MFEIANNAIRPAEDNNFRRKQGLKQNECKKRDCLRCENSFMSTHKGNRLCHNCGGRQFDADVYGAILLPNS